MRKPRPWQNRVVLNNVLRSTKRLARQADLKLIAPIRVRTFRRSFGQNHAENGTPMHVLQWLMRHVNITTTRAFHLQMEDAGEREAVARYEQRIAAPVSAPLRSS